MRFIICDSKGWFNLNSDIQKKNQIKLITKKSDLNIELLKNFNPRYIFFIHWSWIVDAKIYSSYESIVFHTAPLPYGRGGSPIQNLIMRGFKSSPVCALKMTKELDSGPIYSKIEISLEGSLNTIFKRLNNAINDLIRKIITKKIIPIEQVGSAFLFKRLTEKDNEIPCNLNLEEIYDRIRMLDDDKYPNAYIKYGDNKIEFYDAKYKNNSLSVSCKITKWK